MERNPESGARGGLSPIEAHGQSQGQGPWNKDGWLSESKPETEHSLVKSLEREFHLMDYSPWERTAKQENEKEFDTTNMSFPPIRWSPGALRRHLKLLKKDKRKSAVFISTPQDQKKLEGTQVCTSKLCSLQCSHAWSKKRILRSDDVCLLDVKQKVKILKYLILAKKKEMTEYEQHCSILKEMNIKKTKEITMSDDAAMMDARHLLVQYEKLRIGISGIGEWERQDIESAKSDFEATEKMVAENLKEIEDKMQEVNAKIQKARQELRTLKTYKDKEFPVNALRIAELQREVKKLPQIQQAEREEVEGFAQTEMRKLEATVKETEEEILIKVAKDKIRFIPSGLQQLLFHNAVMKKEIEIHKEMNQEIEMSNLELEKKLLHLQETKIDTRKEIFSDVLKKEPHCTPDMDVVLDIPREEWLPI
ncbi:uncharacterized protein C20orf96 homolog [Callorhinchus milii]|uniref:Uncharacterized protein n=1 Tax=Callorhinchus milii TaxID=7868 RepID=V9KUV6_CALMI|nr:uncharacterized protein C20orf96 homolog [Callorhinchus milii]|eukprot:gi/632980143/ref/XP_007906867.1/ PREDICTED: uncharacterized protein C20orf96 homolog [Callorhinchus milii]